MSDVKKIKVGSTSYDCKDATARTQVGRINLTKSGDNLVFTDSSGTQHTIQITNASECPHYAFYSFNISGTVGIRGYNLKTGAHDAHDSSSNFTGSLNLGDLTISVNSASQITLSKAMDLFDLRYFNWHRNVTSLLTNCVLIFDR